MIEIYQYFPDHINPIAFSFGIFEVHWYAISYLVAFLTVYLLLRSRVSEIFNNEIQNSKFKIQNYNAKLKVEIIEKFIIYAIIGLLIGARLGYVFFYNFAYFFKNPLQIISPYDFAQGFYIGISGMSYFGGLLGITLAALMFVRRYKIDFWRWADFIVPAVPAGYFFGRIGNFLNGELYGRATTKFWGMYFTAGGGILRHPSQLYEAFFEGIILFIILWTLRNRSKFPGYLLCLYLLGYGFFRFFIEFFREPDSQIGLFLGFFSLGQIFSLGLMTSSFVLYFWKSDRKMI